jgi:hypothetical protein
VAGRTSSVANSPSETALDALENFLQSVGAPVASTKLSVSDIARVLQMVGKLPRARLVEHIREIVTNPRMLADEPLRVALAKIAVAILPDSLPLIAAILKRSPASQLGEMQFSLFVFLSDAPGFLSQRHMPAIQRLIERYLLSVRSRAAQAAWMAGDLLGDHWPLPQSLPFLLRAAKLAKHGAGREGALHGLAHAIDRGSKRQQWVIVERLKTIAGTDRSPAVRRYAEQILGPLRGV